MELRGWSQQCQRKASPCTGTVSLLPPLWDTLSLIYSQVLKLVSKFPYSKRLVLYFAYRGTTVKLDLGDVRAAGVVCILGLSVGLGTLYIYRLYHQYIQPFLDSHFDPDNSTAFDCNFVLNSSDSAVDGAMGNQSSSGSSPAVFYSPQYGVALGGKSLAPNSRLHVVADSVRMRRSGTRQRPMRRQPLDQAPKSTCSSDLSPSPVYDANIRDSFYSTAESGFETLPECNEEEEEENEGLSQSLMENYSASSLKERNDRYFPSSVAGDQTSSEEKTVVTVSVAGTEEASGSQTVPVIVHSDQLHSSAKSSPARKAETSGERYLSPQRHKRAPSDDCGYDPSLDASESVHSLNSSAEDWSWEEEDREGAFPLAHTAMTDAQFRQSLMQRIREWSAFAQEYGKSRSPTPDCASTPPVLPPPSYMRRSRSLDRHIGEPVFVPELDLSPTEPRGEGGEEGGEGDCTIRSLQCLESEVQGIQDEFQSITSKLHELIHRGADDVPPPPSIPRPPHPHPSPRRPRVRTQWERMPSVARSDSSRSSRASSVEYAWDCGEVGAGGQDGPGPARAGREGARVPVPGASGDAASSKQEPVQEDDEDESEPRVVNVGEPVAMDEYAEREWKGGTPKALTIKQGYSSIPKLFNCRHMRRVRGDNYCALRSTLFQVLVKGHRATQRWPGLISIVDRLHEMNADAGSGLQRWTFADRLHWGESPEEKLATITDCVLSLYATIEEVSSLPSEEERLVRSLCLLNSSQSFDTRLMEGLKLMMLFGASDLQQQMSADGDLPTFAWLLFARDTSPDVLAFVHNHLNHVGSSAGIDQVEMCLLGHCLGVRLRVARLDHCGQEDFDVTFPDEAPEDWPCIALLAEDDRHYNVPVA